MVKPLIRTWIQGSCARGDIIAMLAGCQTLRFRQSRDLFTADMVLYTGGADVNPSLYGEAPLTQTVINLAQDKEDLACFRAARQGKKFQVGICRGSQFLNVMNGGKLWQHVNNHAGVEHLIRDHETNDIFLASSTHHQMSIPTNKAQILATSNESTEKLSFGRHWDLTMGDNNDVEAYWYSAARCLGVQWHPEWGPKECTERFFSYIEKYINEGALPSYGSGARCA